MADTYDLKNYLLGRGDLTEEEVDELIEEMRDRVADGEDPEDVLYDEGIEPDFVFDILI
jgi:hypothetical protein